MANETASKSISARIAKVFDKVEPLPIIIFFFLLFGGVHQTYSLYSIGFPYLRFFSATQLLSDSIANFLLAISTAYIPSYLGIVITTKLIKWINKAVSFNVSIFFTTIIIIIFLFYLRITFPDYQLIVICALLGSSVVLIDKDNSEKALTLPIWIRFLAITPIVFFFMIISISERLSNKQLNFELENFNKIHKTYQAKGIKDNILYFNDNYIFVEIKKDTIYPDKKIPKKRWKKTIRKIEILKFDKFFE